MVWGERGECAITCGVGGGVRVGGADSQGELRQEGCPAGALTKPYLRFTCEHLAWNPRNEILIQNVTDKLCQYNTTYELSAYTG